MVLGRHVATRSLQARSHRLAQGSSRRSTAPSCRAPDAEELNAPEEPAPEERRVSPEVRRGSSARSTPGAWSVRSTPARRGARAQRRRGSCRLPPLPAAAALPVGGEQTLQVRSLARVAAAWPQRRPVVIKTAVAPGQARRKQTLIKPSDHVPLPTGWRRTRRKARPRESRSSEAPPAPGLVDGASPRRGSRRGRAAIGHTRGITGRPCAHNGPPEGLER